MTSTPLSSCLAVDFGGGCFGSIAFRLPTQPIPFLYQIAPCSNACIDLCNKFTIIKFCWDFELDYGIGYPLTIKLSNKWSFKGCLIDCNYTTTMFNDNSIVVYGPKLALSEVCQQDSKLITWTAYSAYILAMKCRHFEQTSLFSIQHNSHSIL